MNINAVSSGELVMALKALYRGFVNLPTQNCFIGNALEHLGLDQACLEVSNIDASSELEFWAQSKECYKCPPWKYISLVANSSENLVVNTTYPTDVFIRNQNGSDIHRLSYHFGEYGEYKLQFDAKNLTDIDILSQPHLENVLPIILTIMYFSALAFIWQCGKLLMRRMDPSSDIPVPPTAVTERSPLLVSTSNVEQLSPSDPQPGPSSQSDPQSDSSESSPSQPVQVIHVQELVPDSRRSGGRLLSLDTFRGLAIVIMIFVNYGGGQYYFFQHARWNGLTVADLVFPWFLWIMGVSLSFSIRSQLRRATKRYIIILRIVKRCIILFALGIIINSDSNNGNYLPTFRILGVLQRFAICYFVNAAIEVYCTAPQQSPEYVWYWKVRDIVRSWKQWFLILILVFIHIYVTFALPVPGCPTGYLGPGGLHDGGAYSNCTGGAAGYIDSLVLGVAHVYPHPTCKTIYDTTVPYDPEGILGALNSILMVQFGVAAGRIIITHRHHRERLIRWLIWGTATGLIAGFLCGWQKEGGLIPVNKNLWSLSYVLTTTCFAFFLLSFFYLIIDKLCGWSGNPIRYAGMNAIVLYVGHEICGGLLPWSWTPVGNYHVNYLNMNVWGTSLWIITAYLLHRKKVYISV